MSNADDGTGGLVDQCEDEGSVGAEGFLVAPAAVFGDSGGGGGGFGADFIDVDHGAMHDSVENQAFASGDAGEVGACRREDVFDAKGLENRYRVEGLVEGEARERDEDAVWFEGTTQASEGVGGEGAFEGIEALAFWGQDQE